MPRPGLVLGSWGEVGNHDLHGLKLLVFRRNGAHLVGDLIACHGNILAFDVRNVYEDVRSSICGGNEAMAFGATEAFADTFVDGALRCSHSC